MQGTLKRAPCRPPWWGLWRSHGYLLGVRRDRVSPLQGSPDFRVKLCGPGGIQTRISPFSRRALYSIELRGPRNVRVVPDRRVAFPLLGGRLFNALLDTIFHFLF